MSTRISADNLAGELKDILGQFAKATYADIKAATDATAKETVKNTKGASPVKTGKYKRGWGSTVTADNVADYSVTVHNKKRYMLTHLLQNGHGGPRPARPHPHIQEDGKTAEIFERNLAKEME